MKLLGLIVLTAIALCAQPARTAPSAEDTASIQGRVYNVSSKKPLANVKILLFCSGSGKIKGTRTDERGVFSFDPIEPATYRLTANKNGYAHLEYRGPEPGSEPAEFVITEGQDLKDVVFLLEPAAVVVGRVVDEQGEPVGGARVFLNVQERGRSRYLLPRGHAETNDLGEYRIHNVQPGRYSMAVDFEDDLLNDPGIEYAGLQDGNYARVYYPGVIDPDQAAHIELNAGEVRGVDFQLQRLKSVRVRGTLSLATPGPSPPHISIELTPNRDLLGFVRRRQASLDAENRAFGFVNVTSGAYVLTADARFNDANFYAYREIEVGRKDIEELDLVLAPGAVVSGRVHIESNERNQRSPELQELRVSLYGGWHNPGNSGAAVDKSGTFEIEDVAYMTYSVGATGLPPDAYLKRVMLERRNLPDRKFNVAPAARIDDLELFISLGGGRLEGVVVGQDGRPFSGATVVAIPEEDTPLRPRLVKAEKSDQLGRYTIRGLVPGRYRLIAFEQMEAGAYYEPRFLKEYESEGETIAVEEYAELELMLKVQELKGDHF